MSFPNSVDVGYQVVDFSFPRVLIFKLAASSAFFFVYPLTRIYPRKKPIFSKFPDDVQTTNNEFQKDLLEGWDRIEKCVINKKVHGLILYYNEFKYFFPFVVFDTSEFPVSTTRLSLNFKKYSELREFEDDKFFVVKLINSLVFLNRNSVEWNCEVNEEMFTGFYNRVINSEYDPTKELIIYCLDEEMKNRLEYLKKTYDVNVLKYSNLLFDWQINKLQIYRSRKLVELEQPKITSYLITDKNQQCFTLHSNVYVLKKFSGESQARSWLDPIRLHALFRTTYTRSDQKAFPNISYQFYISIYDNIFDYTKETIEDIDGYKISIISHQNSFYVLIPIFIKYLERSIKDCAKLLSSTSYWTIENELVIDGSPVKFPFKIEIVSVVLESKFIMVLERSGSVWLIKGDETPKLMEIEPVFKITGQWLLSRKRNLYFLDESFETEIVDSPVENVWSFEKSVIYKINNKIVVRAEKKFKVPYKEDWKNFVYTFGLTYQGLVINLVTREIVKFPEKIIEISYKNEKLFAWNKTRSFILYKNKIDEIERACQILDSDIKLTLGKKNEK
jgi:hypothetical protein